MTRDAASDASKIVADAAVGTDRALDRVIVPSLDNQPDARRALRTARRLPAPVTSGGMHPDPLLSQARQDEPSECLDLGGVP